jgi:hypothetical protein
VGVGVLGLDALEEPPEGGDVGDVGLLGRAAPTVDHAEDLAVPGKHDGARIALVREAAVVLAVGAVLAVGDDGDLERVLLDDSVLGKGALDRHQSVGAPDGRASRTAVLDDEQARLVVGVAVHLLRDLVCLHDAPGREEAVDMHLVVSPVIVVGEHELGKVARGVLVSYASGQRFSSARRFSGTQRRKRGRTEIELVSYKRRLVDHCGVNLDEPPVLGVAKGLNINLDGR